jgi:regulator of replication initiation timing
MNAESTLRSVQQENTRLDKIGSNMRTKLRELDMDKMKLQKAFEELQARANTETGSLRHRLQIEQSKAAAEAAALKKLHHDQLETIDDKVGPCNMFYGAKRTAARCHIRF